MSDFTAHNDEIDRLIKMGDTLGRYGERLGINHFVIKYTDPKNKRHPRLDILFHTKDDTDNYDPRLAKLIADFPSEFYLKGIADMPTRVIDPDLPRYIHDFPRCRFHNEPLPSPR